MNQFFRRRAGLGLLAIMAAATSALVPLGASATTVDLTGGVGITPGYINGGYFTNVIDPTIVGTGKIDPAVLERELPALIGGATPRAIREHLGLNKPIYARTAAYGHFGRDADADGGFSWEKTDLVDKLKALV